MSSGGMLLDGERTSGQDVRTQNVTAAMAIANIVKTSLGPVGLDKMLVDEIGDVTITNDGATILAQLDIEHPAAKVLVELAQLQDQEVGDGTTSVVIVAAELLKRANELVKNNIHPTVVMAGYRLAAKEAVKYIKSNLVVSADSLGRPNLINAGNVFHSLTVLHHFICKIQPKPVCPQKLLALSRISSPNLLSLLPSKLNRRRMARPSAPLATFTS
jgi:T-complex protein 1 subunit alpha